MNRTLLIGSILIILLGCKASKKVNTAIDIDFKELNYGICETRAIYAEEMENSPSGNHIYSNGFRMVEQTDKIPATLGQKFAIEYEILSKVSTDITVEQVWIFPTKIRDDNGKEFEEIRYKSQKPTNDRTYSTYNLEKNYEVIKGEWIYQMYFNGKKIHERKFYLE